MTCELFDMCPAIERLKSLENDLSCEGGLEKAKREYCNNKDGEYCEYKDSLLNVERNQIKYFKD